MRPGKRTPGMWREEQNMPSKSHIALALSYAHQSHLLHSNLYTYFHDIIRKVTKGVHKRLRINLIQKPTPILLIENPRKPPRLLLHRLHILDLDEQHVARFRGLDVEGSREVVDAAEVDVFDIVGGVVVADLAAGPVYAFDFDDFVVFDGGVGWDWGLVRGVREIKGLERWGLVGVAEADDA
jgi:hypothetical protein